MKRTKKLSLLSAAALVVGIFTPILVAAASINVTVIDKNAQQGMLMSMTDNPGVAEPATDKNAAALAGVLAPDETNFERQPGQVTVKTDGQDSALVSTLNGDIRVGDKIAVSSLSGIGAKAVKNAWIVGTAQGSLDVKTKGAVKTTVRDSKGGSHEVYIARIPVLINVTYYSDPKTSVDPASPVPESIQQIANAIAGKKVSLIGLLLSFLLLLIGTLLAGMVINAAIRNGFAAIARQPLTKVIVLREMLQSFGMAVLILGIVIVGALLLLRLL